MWKNFDNEELKEEKKKEKLQKKIIGNASKIGNQKK